MGSLRHRRRLAGENLDVVCRKDAALSFHLAFEPAALHLLQDNDDIAGSEWQIARLRGGEVVQSASSRHGKRVCAS